MPQENITKTAKISTAKNGSKGQQRSNLEQDYIKKLISPGVLFVQKISYLQQNQFRVGTKPLYYVRIASLRNLQIIFFNIPYTY